MKALLLISALLLVFSCGPYEVHHSGNVNHEVDCKDAAAAAAEFCQGDPECFGQFLEQFGGGN